MSEVHEMLRKAVDQKIALWQTIREIEKTIDLDCDSFEGIIDQLASGVDSGDDLNTKSLDKVLEDVCEEGASQ